MRELVAIVFFAAVLAGCGTSGGEQLDGTTSTERDSTAATSHIDKCIDRLLSRATTSGATEQQVRRYVRDTYCALFEQNGWVYDDGALSIAAQTWLDNGETCSSGTRTVPCETNIVDCALLHHVRRTEVMAYVADRQRAGDVHCDDETPLEELGVP